MLPALVTLGEPEEPNSSDRRMPVPLSAALLMIVPLPAMRKGPATVKPLDSVAVTLASGARISCS